MTTTTRTAAPRGRTAAAVEVPPADYDGFLAKLSTKDRLNVERHVAALEAAGDSRHAETWRQMASTLFALAPNPIKSNGQQSLQFFIPDGKYRMQVFALQDLRDGAIVIYCGNVLAQAVRDGLV